MRLDAGKIIVLAAALAFVGGGPAASETVYSWVTEDGTYAFTDDEKRIPAKYKAEAKRRDLGKLKNYDRLTESNLGSDDGYGKRLDSRLDGLRQQAPGPVVRGTARPMAAGRDSTYFGVATSNRTGLQMPIQGDGGKEPLLVERIRSKRKGGNATRHLTVIKQGDRVISVVAPNYTDGDAIQAHDSDFY